MAGMGWKYHTGLFTIPNVLCGMATVDKPPALCEVSEDRIHLLALCVAWERFGYIQPSLCVVCQEVAPPLHGKGWTHSGGTCSNC